VNTSTAGTVDWRTLAACRGTDPDLFFPPGAPHAEGSATQVAAAQAVCRACPVTTPCLTFALAEPEGIWAGTTPADRFAVRRSLTRGAP